MTQKIWLNSEGKVLVNSDGKPYYTEECCCLSSKLFCWVQYEARCIDADGSDVYGQSGTHNSDTEQWTQPYKVGWSCAAEWPTNLGVVSEWTLAAAGTARIWLNAGSDCDSATCSEATANPPAIGIPCSCNPIWGNVAFELPYYDYGVTTISGAPVWQVNGQSGASRTRVARKYLANYGTGDLLTPAAAQHPSSNYGSYKVMQGNGWTFYEIPGAGIFVPADGGKLWVENGTIKSLGEGNLPVSVGQASSAFVSFLSVFEPGWTADFASNKWGVIEIAKLDNRGAGEINMNYVMEARGGFVEASSVYTEHGVLGASMAGAPMYHYRCYITTVVPIADINSGNLAWALGQSSAEHSLATCWAQAAALQCEEYRHLYIAAAWGNCQDDPAKPVPFSVNSTGSNLSGAFCTPPNMTAFMAPCDEAYPLPYYANGNMPWDWPTTTYWLHEDDEAVGPGGQPLAIPALRRANVSSDGHAYKVIQLSIDNYPSWFVSDLCSGIPGNPEVPALDFSDSAYYCNLCGSGTSCQWPHLSASLPVMTKSDSYPSSWGPVYGVSPIGLGGSSKADCGINELMWQSGGLTPAVSGNTTTWMANLASVYAMSGCPEYGWSVWKWVRSTVKKECLATSGSTSKWRDDGQDVNVTVGPLYYVENADGYYDTRYIGGNMTWQGNVVTPASCGSAIPGPVSVFTGSISGQGAMQSSGNYRSQVTVEAGLFMYQYPLAVCNETDHLRYDVGGPPPYSLSYYMSCMLSGGSPSECCAGSANSDCAEYYELGSGTVITFVASASIIARSNRGQSAVNDGTWAESNYGSIDTSEWHNTSNQDWPYTAVANVTVSVTTTLSSDVTIGNMTLAASGLASAAIASAVVSSYSNHWLYSRLEVWENMFDEATTTLVSTADNSYWAVESVLPTGSTTSYMQWLSAGLYRERNAAGCYQFKLYAPAGFVMPGIDQHEGPTVPGLFSRSRYGTSWSNYSYWSKYGSSGVNAGSNSYVYSYYEYQGDDYQYGSSRFPIPYSDYVYPLFDPIDIVRCGLDAAQYSWTNHSVCESSNGANGAWARCVVSYKASGSNYSTNAVNPMGEPTEIWDTWDVDCYAVTEASVTIQRVAPQNPW